MTRQNYSFGRYLKDSKRISDHDLMQEVIESTYLETNVLLRHAGNIPVTYYPTRDLIIFASDKGITDLYGLENAPFAHKLILTNNNITDIRTLPEYIKTKYPGLIRKGAFIDLRGNPIDFTDPINRCSAEQLRMLGIKVRFDTQYNTPDTTKDSIEAALIAAGIPEQAIAPQRNLWDTITDIARGQVESANKVFHVHDMNDRRLILKVFNDENRANTEAAANYWLSQRLEFIVPGMTPEPIRAGNITMTLQEEISCSGKSKMPLDYWIRTIAKFHNNAGQILAEKNVKLPPVIRLRDSLEYAERHKMTQATNETTLDKPRLEDSIAYINLGIDDCVIHADLKKDNLHGPYLIDLENCCRGDPSIDLAMLFTQYNVPEGQWETMISRYIDARGNIEHETHLKRLVEGTRNTKYAILMKEILGTSSRSSSERTTEQNRRLARYLE
ncbi:MAG: aminoglycoside phosphotransferase family protein [Candidatus Woesearchaeota archaeon]